MSMSFVVEQAKVYDFVELVMNVESSLEEGIHVFKLAELHDAYENCLNNLNIDFSANTTRLKGELLDYFQDNKSSQMERMFFLIFSIGMYSLLQNILLS